ncbi:MAG: glycosyltransferase [Phycisphaerales bacterium]
MGELTTMLSFIIPAYNEETLIEATVKQLQVSVEALGRDYEIIVVNDASTDRTERVAEAAGARVINVTNRQIAATRNAGAANAAGDVFIFVDADTLVPVDTLRAALCALDNGATGGGAAIRFRGRISATARITASLMQVPMRLGGMVGGCFMFMTRDAFEAVGGYDESFYASEEIWLARALRREGRFVILRQFTETSGRKLRQYGLLRLLGTLVKLALRGPKGMQRRAGLEVWYDAQREPKGQDD